MPTPSSEPLRLQVINRIVTVLSAITAGATYWYTPSQVCKRYIHPQEVQGDITYMVSTGSGGQLDLAGMAGASSVYDEDLIISVKGYVRHDSDTVTVLERALHDVRNAIDADARDEVTAGSLGVLTVECRIERGPETDNGYFSLMGLGFFDQEIRCRITGTYGEL
jgi:hypothetical protein